MTNGRSMASPDLDTGLSPTVGTALPASQRALRDSQPALCRASCPEAGNHPAVGQSGEGRDPEIDTYRGCADAHWWSRQLHRKSNGPPLRISPEGAAPDDSLLRHRPMQMHAQRSWHAFESKLPLLQRD